MFNHTKIIFSYLLLCLLSFSLFFIIFTPTQFISDYFLDQKANNAWKVTNEQGNIWQGNLNLTHKKGLTANINWLFKPLNYFTNDVVIAINLNNQHSKLTLNSQLSSFDPQFILNGTLDAAHITRSYPLPQHASMTGTITINDLSFNNNPPYYIQSGNLLWSGGKVSANRKTNKLPKLNLLLETEQQDLVINIIEHNSQLNLINIHAHTNKQADIKLYQQLLTLTKQGALSEQPTDVVIRFTEKLKF